MERGPTGLVTVLATEGSAPRGAGARMVVTGSALQGTIGGGALEHQASAQARSLLELPRGSWRIQDYPLGPLLGQCCGGRVRLLIEHLGDDAIAWLAAPHPALARLTPDRILRSPDAYARPGPVLARGERPETFLEPIEVERRPVLLFGAGHVGRAIAERAQGLRFQIGWYDCREEAARTPGVMLADPEAMAACARDASADTAILILTHDHGLDYELTAAALRSAAGYVGLIGSQTKRARFLSRLAAEGVDSARLTCPIGLPGIHGKEPESIAIAVLAQLLSLSSLE